MSSGGNHLSPYFEFSHVSIAFGSNRVLNDVSFRVMPGETVCILGRSGVGKSVCLRVLLGLLRPDEGQVIVAHEDVTKYSENEFLRIRKKVTMVFQSGALFDSLTVAENVAFTLRERDNFDEDTICKTVDEVLGMVNLKSMRDRLPSDLSTGMKRSVAIARALTAKPQAVLYDEPTTMVDPLMARVLSNLIQRLKLQMKLTSIVVTHDTRLAQKLADHVIFLDEAKVVFSGTAVEMERAQVPIVQQFLALDRLDLRAMLAILQPSQSAHKTA